MSQIVAFPKDCMNDTWNDYGLLLKRTLRDADIYYLLWFVKGKKVKKIKKCDLRGNSYKDISLDITWNCNPIFW